MTSHPTMRLIKTGGPKAPSEAKASSPHALRLVVQNGRILPGYARIVLFDTSHDQLEVIAEQPVNQEPDTLTY